VSFYKENILPTELIYTLVMTHITIMCVTLYLHRSQAHMAVQFHPAVSHFMRFWLWLTTGMVTKQWVAVHRKHHVYSDKPGDPHSPHVWGIFTVLLKGAFLYHEATSDAEMVEQYGKRTPTDWIENNLYTLHSKLGITCMLVIDVVLFNGWGLLIWAIQMLWIPIWAAGVINGVAHWLGYRNGESRDHSTNISAVGIVIGGEELHNNHHLQPASAKFSIKWYEFDMGWAYIKVLDKLGLAKVS
jgi:stearoyl-CoA desaturase (delta-9 desaturase)